MFMFQTVDGSVLDDQWSEPIRLSTRDIDASEGYMVSDRYGYVHTFWIEKGFPDNRSVIQYSRFDGESWSTPNDIYISQSGTTIGRLSPFIDSQDIIYLSWTEGISGPVYLSTSSIDNANSAQGWDKPIRLDIPAYWIRFLVDGQGTYHLIFSVYYDRQPGVYYIRSENEGHTWSIPVWIDPDIPLGYVPQRFQAAIGEGDILHVLWYYSDPNSPGVIGKWIRYSHSLDRGVSWSQPMTIDIAEDMSNELRLPYPLLQVNGSEVHVIWAGDEQTHRSHRYSFDTGLTWSPIQPILGKLHGQASGGGLATDTSGRMHYVDQVRWPQGVYHATWWNGTWSVPSMIYFIAFDSDDAREGRIHAHHVRLAIRAGDQLVVTFTDSPGDPIIGLYAMHQLLRGNAPTQVPEIPLYQEHPTTTTAQPTMTPAATPGIADSVDEGDKLQVPDDQNNSNPADAIIWGVIPSVFVLIGYIVYSQIFNKRK